MKTRELGGSNPLAHDSNVRNVSSTGGNRLGALSKSFGSSNMMASLSSNHDNAELKMGKNKANAFIMTASKQPKETWNSKS